MEHRWGERFNVDIGVRLASRPFATRAAMRTGRLLDLSLSGACIQAPLDLRRLMRVQVALILPQRFAQATPVISGYVVRRSEDRIGVEWCEFAPRAVVELLRAAADHRTSRPHRHPGPESDTAETLPLISVRSR